MIERAGNTGNSSVPLLHLHLMDAPCRSLSIDLPILFRDVDPEQINDEIGENCNTQRRDPWRLQHGVALKRSMRRSLIFRTRIEDKAVAEEAGACPVDDLGAIGKRESERGKRGAGSSTMAGRMALATFWTAGRGGARMELQKEWGSYAVLQVLAEAIQNGKFDEDLRLTAKEAVLLESSTPGQGHRCIGLPDQHRLTGRADRRGSMPSGL